MYKDTLIGRNVLISNAKFFLLSLNSNLKPTYIMRILVFSLFLCLNLFTSNAQSNSKFTSATLLVNGVACDKCTLELTREQLKKMILSTTQDDVKIASFKLKTPGLTTIPVGGNQLSPKISIALRKANIGSSIQFFDIRTNKGLIKTSVIVKLIK